MGAKAVKKAIVYGAGNVGRGFLGQLFSESGYEVVFVDVVRELVAALNARRSYRLRLVSNERAEEILVGPVRALDAGDTEKVIAEIADAELMATAVGVRALPKIAPVIALGIARRAERSVPNPLNIILCENLKDVSHIFREMLQQHLSVQYHAYLSERVGLVEAVIARMVPLVPPELQEDDPTLILAEPYKALPVNKLGFVGPIPTIVGLEPQDNFAAYVDRKLYLHNMGHAMLGYLGHQKGLTYGYEALEDADIRPWLQRAFDESQRALIAAYSFDPIELQGHVNDLIRRFGNRALGDTVLRLARDPLRKLGANDRLVGAARLAWAHHVLPEALTVGIAAGLAYDDPRDPQALELQKRLAEEGLEEVLCDICGLHPQDPLAQMVIERYECLRQGKLFRCD